MYVPGTRKRFLADVSISMISFCSWIKVITVIYWLFANPAEGF
jgi:hypothetical protein